MEKIYVFEVILYDYDEPKKVYELANSQSQIVKMCEGKETMVLYTRDLYEVDIENIMSFYNHGTIKQKEMVERFLEYKLRL